MQCRSQKIPFKVPMRVECCEGYDFCNIDLKPNLTKEEKKRHLNNCKCLVYQFQ